MLEIEPGSSVKAASALHLLIWCDFLFKIGSYVTEPVLYDCLFAYLFGYLVVLFLFFESGSHYVALASLELNMQTRPPNHEDVPVSASRVLGLKTCTTMTGQLELLTPELSLQPHNKPFKKKRFVYFYAYNSVLPYDL